MDASLEKRRVRILLATQTLGTGGSERVLCTVMRQFDPEKYEIHLVVVSRPGKLLELVPTYVQIHYLNVKHTSLALPALVRLLRKIQPDRVFSSEENVLIMLTLASRLSGRPEVIGRGATMPTLARRNNFRQSWREIVKKLVYPRLDAMVAQNPEMAEELHSLYGIARKRLHSLDNPLDVDYIAEKLDGLGSPFAPKTFNLLSVGTFYPPKGFDILIRAFASLPEEWKSSRVTLNILGADYQDGKKNLQALAKSLELESRINFLEYSKNPYVYMKFCDLYVLSSRREGMPNALLEARFLRRVLVATRCIPAITRIVQEGVNGYTAPVNDVPALAKALQIAMENHESLTPPEPDLARNRELSLFIAGEKQNAL